MKEVTQYLADKTKARTNKLPIPQHPPAPRLVLDKDICDNLPVADFEYVVRDATVEPMYIRVRPSGVKAIYVERRVNGKTSKAKITSWGASAEYAFKTTRRAVSIRDRALDVLREMGAGVTPTAKRDQRRIEAAEKAAQAERSGLEVLTLKEAVDEYINDDTDRAQGTTDNYKRALANLTEYHDRPLLSIGKDDVVAMHKSVQKIAAQRGRTGASAANTALKLFRAAWNYQAEEHDDMPQAPTGTLSSKKKRTRNWSEEKRRERIVHEKEMADWWTAVERLRGSDFTGDGDLMADYLQFALLAGMRRREMTLPTLTWKKINFRREELVLDVEDTKGKRKWTLPLTPAMIEILERRKLARDKNGKPYAGPFPIEEPRRAINKVAVWSGVAFSMHDLRRTYATLGEAEGVAVPLSTMGYMLNHSQNKQNTTSGYQIANIENARRYMVRLQNYILTLAGVDSNVVKLEAVSNG